MGCSRRTIADVGCLDGIGAWWFGRPLASELDNTHQLRLRHTWIYHAIAVDFNDIDPFARTLGLKDLV